MNKIENTRYLLNISSIIQVINDINVKWDSQLCVTSRSGNDLFDGVGSINDYPGANEWDFTVINTEFRGTDLERVINEIKADGYLPGRVRIMRMQPKSVYSYHMDREPRLHFSLVTNEKCMFIVDDEVIRIPANGAGYLLDTTRYHTAINASNSTRIHVVMGLTIPVKQISNDINRYQLLNTLMTQDEFDNWLVDTKPVTENSRIDYFFTKD